MWRLAHLQSVHHDGGSLHQGLQGQEVSAGDERARRKGLSVGLIGEVRRQRAVEI